MGVRFEINCKDLSDLQMHMERLIKYYEADVAALGRIAPYVTGDALKCLTELAQQRLGQLYNADYLLKFLLEK